MAYIWRFPYITNCRWKAFYEDEYVKINELSNFKCKLASHINKSRYTACSPIKLFFWSPRHLEDVFNVTIFPLRGVFEETIFYAKDVLKTSSRHIFKTSSGHALKASSRIVFNTSWSHPPDVLEINKIFTGKESISVSIKSKYLSDKFLSNKPIWQSKSKPRQIQLVLIKTQ